MTQVIDEQQLRRGMALDEDTLSAIEEGFIKLARGEVEIPPILGLEMPEKNGAADVKAAYVRGWEGFAIKVSTRFFDNPQRGLASAGGLILYFDADTGQTLAIFTDNGYLTTLRTALAGALAAKYLAPAQVDTVTVFGAGSQAVWQVRALALVRNFRRVQIVARNQQRAVECARELSRELNVDAQPAGDAAYVVAQSQVVITTTPSTRPIVEPHWLHPGVHITAMGADAEHKNELHPEVWKAAQVLVCDKRSQCETRGELRHALAAGAVTDASGVQELGEVIIGESSGRRQDDQISVCDLTGVGVQDTAIARLAWQRAKPR